MRALLPSIGLLVLLIGCQPAQEAPPAPALALDPTDPADPTGWWSNGDRLLHLMDDDRFRLYTGTNRYVEPDQVGRWSSGGYAVVWLEPYRTRRHMRLRLGLGREDGVLLLSMPGEPPMMLLDGPPRAVEDRLIGTWTGAGGTLELQDDLVFVLRAGTATNTAGCTGRWWLDGSSVNFEPVADIPPAWLLQVELEEADVAMRRDGEVVWRLE